MENPYIFKKIVCFLLFIIIESKHLDFVKSKCY